MVAPQEMDLMMAEANKLDVDVLCWGGTHRFDAYEYENKFFVNPGSATGAMTTGWMGEGEELVPSFCLMDVSLSCSYGQGFSKQVRATHEEHTLIRGLHRFKELV